MTETNSAALKKLTKRKKETGEIYTRRAEVELQIENVLWLETAEIIRLLQNKHRETENYLLDETIVYLLRDSKIDENFREDLYVELNRRIWKLLKKFRTNFINQADFEDFGQKIEMAVLRKIFDFETNSADYAEVNFGDYVVKTAKVVWRGERVKIRRDKDLFYSHSDDSDDENYARSIENTIESGDAPADFVLTLREGLAKLPPNIMLVAELLLDGWQVESKDEREPTISKKLGVSSRTIRNWIKEAKNILADYRAEVKK